MITSLALEIIIWFTNSLIGNAVCFSLIGVAFGPVFPAALMFVSDILPDDLRSGAMGLIGSIAGAGGAVGPLVTGAISDRYGLWTLQPVMAAMMAGDLVAMFFITRLSRKKPRNVA